MQVVRQSVSVLEVYPLYREASRGDTKGGKLQPRTSLLWIPDGREHVIVAAALPTHG